MNAESHQQDGDLSEFVKNPHSLWPAVRISDVPYQAEELLENLQEYENNFKYCFQPLPQGKKAQCWKPQTRPSEQIQPGWKEYKHR